ncbi:MAG: diacylglycerol kinase [Treponema sp.]|nr:diacylglycerol kinase [Treponema sp.]
MDCFFAQAIADICQHSLVSVDRPLRCMIIVNPVAGGFAIESKWENRVNILNEYKKKAMANQQRAIYKNVIVNITEGKGSAGEITKGFIERAVKDPVPFYLIISAGGDGTHCEVLYSVYNAPAHVRSNMAVLRLPMGTGNDGADHPNLGNALNLLIKPSHIEYARAVQLITAKDGPSNWKGPFLAFNILSVGLDAYVTHKTNEMKRKKPGDSYGFWVDMAALVYDKAYKVDYINLRALDEKNQELFTMNEKFLLLAMGATGNRTYGSQKQILPNNYNVCSVKQMSLINKLIIKGQVSKGKHANNPNAFLFNAHRVEFSGKHEILAQMDGEAFLLQPEDFPAALELTAPIIPILKLG